MQGLVEKVLVIVLLVGAVWCSDVVVLTEANFDAMTSSGEWLLEFYAPWCGHCKNLAPTYEELATKVKGQFNVAKIDCTVEKALQQRFAIRGFPTIKFLKDGTVYDFSGQRQVASFVDFMNSGYSSAQSNPLPKAAPPPPPASTQEHKPSSSSSDVIVLTDSNFHELTQHGTWFLEFYAPWCGHCKRLAPIYEEVATALKGVVKVGKIDCTSEKGVCSQYDIGGYPTVYYQREDGIRAYEGQRTKDEFVKFAESGWKNSKAQPVPEPIGALPALFHSIIGHIENMSGNIFLLIVVCIVVGVLLGVCVVAMSPSSSSNKTIHYSSTSTSTSSPSPTSAPAGEITTDEVSKED